ncbi:MAG TPA: Ig-like domain-containing protein [Candidatus Methylomirabilis sp.]|nr:Ig-like domain-containing protein [Candidatus Methylomirabilis sp.]
MRTLIFRALTALLLLVAVAVPGAHALLERVGPVSNTPSVGGYPAWYQDTTGLTLEFCDPKNTAEVAGGFCLLLPGDVPNPPEVFPTNFFDEHFYFAAGATLTAANTGKATLVLAVEGAFAVGPPIPGDQVTFSRIRVKLTNVPATGTYRFIHPYGEELLDGVQGDVIFFTDDVGIGAPGDFSGALSSRLGPFLLASNTPGGPELPGFPGPSGLYIADPARLGPVTGSALPDFTDSAGAARNHNIFRIEGPTGSNLGGPGVDFIETTDFSLMGRILTTAIPGRVDVSRASYTRNATGQQKVDVFATAFETVQGRVPTQPRPPAVTPVLSFFDAPCTATLDAAGNPGPPFSAPATGTETQMFAAPSNFWGQIQPAAIPVGVCVKDASARDAAGNIVPAYFPKGVTDEVTITQALYDGIAHTLTVAAISSDAVTLPTLTLPLLVGATPAPGSGDLASPATWTVTPLAAPPAKVRVLSSFGGAEELKVTTAFGVGAPPGGTPVANNDAFTFAEDSGAQILDVLTNDTNATGGTVTLVALPRLGTASVTGGTVTYTPNLNAFGSDSFTYTVTVGTTTSNVANVAITITPVNDPPVANPDSFTAVANLASTLNVTANDTDPDGAADIVAVANVSAVTPAVGTPGTGTATAVGKDVSFTATAAGIYSFTYQAQDAAGAQSNPTTVTVTVASAETITIALAEYRITALRYRVNGTISPVANQTMTIELRNAAGTVLRTDTAPSPGGAWAIDIRGITVPVGSTVRVTSSNGTVATATVVRRQ